MRLLAILTLLFALMQPAFAHDDATGIVKTRMDRFVQSQQALKASFHAVKAGRFDEVIAHAREMAEWGRTMPQSFPEGSLYPPSEASPQIWQDWDGFTQAGLAFAAAADAVAHAAETGHAGDTTAALKALGRSCKSCHATYRQK